MPHAHHKERLWNLVIWPVLWPLLLAQFALVVLCFLVGMVMWWMMPLYVSWSRAGGLMLVLLLGSGLNVWAFLVLLRSRLKQREDQYHQHLLEVEQQIEELKRERQGSSSRQEVSFMSTDATPLERLEEISKGLSRLLDEPIPSPLAPREEQETDQALLNDLQQHQQQLEQLLAGRERAREESRLKTGYISVLQREIDKLMTYLDTWGQRDIDSECRRGVIHMREQLADIGVLLSSLGDDTSVNVAAGPVSPASSKAMEGRASAPSVSRRRLTVLVVDDGPVNLMLARQVLERQGLEVASVTSGYQALERQKRTHFDLVFMDIFMPSMDGMQTSRLWRAAEQAAGRKPSILVALTANIDQAGREQCRQAGLDDLLAKPYQPQALLQVIDKWFPARDKENPDA